MTSTRVLTALVLIPLVVVLDLFTSTTAVALATAVVTVLALWEYFVLGEAIGHRAYRLWTIFCALVFVFVQLLHVLWQARYIWGDTDFFLANYIPRAAPTTTPILFFFVFGLTILTIFTRRPLVEVLPSAGISSSALLLIAFPLSYAVRLHGIPTYGPRLLLFALVIIWVGDTAAYFLGRAIGKHQLAPHISPKKTWEGAIGSMLGSLLVAYVFRFWIPIRLPHLFAMAAAGNLAGQLGDLLESACKRSAGVKDSGGLLPGHGGVLDRIDALILCIPVIWYYLVFVQPPIL
jgi:phosphatidate cytidylyltransferase